jgi:hypothetical protein
MSKPLTPSLFRGAAPLLAALALAATGGAVTAGTAGCGSDDGGGGGAVDTGNTAFADTGFGNSDPGPPKDTAKGPDLGATDFGPATDPGNTNGCAVPGTKPIMSACSDDCECATGYCYDEAFLGDFRFCSVDCSTGDPCSGLPNPDGSTVQAYQCLTFTTSLKATYGLTVTSLCALRCTDVAQCQAYSSAYDACGNSAFGTEWDGYTVGVKTCLISDRM